MTSQKQDLNFFILKKYLRSIIYLLSIQGAGLIILSIFRFILFVENQHNISVDIASNIPLQSIAFIRGLWFDNVVACYILILPLAVVSIASLFNYYGKRLYLGINIFFITLYTLAFAIAAANIPYFNYFFKPINASIFNWMDYAGPTLGMITGEKSYYFPIFFFILSSVVFAYLCHVIRIKFQKSLKKKEQIIHSHKSQLSILGCSALLIGLCLFGIRGRMGYNPIKISAAYYCNNAFLNQLGLNPAFYLLQSSLDALRPENQTVHLINESIALSNTKRYLAIEHPLTKISPIAHLVEAKGKPVKANVVIILMESMSANLMQTFGQQKRLTPFLDSLYHESLSFNHFFSSGIHTNHGLYSTLYSFPAMMKRNLMKGAVIPNYSGLPTILKDNGYHNLFFMTHESQYDNMNAFFRTNGYDEIYSQENYPSSKVANSFGVQDDYLFDFALPVLNRKAATKKPFFATLLTVSNHPPYVIPPYFHPKSSKPEDQIVEYADWSIKKFMDGAKKQPWFNNTIFVFVADHGKMVGEADCEMPQSYNHIPLIIYSKLLHKEQKDCIGGQVDIAPTLLGLLNISYTRNSFGIDLLKEKRPCMFFTSDNMIGCKDSSRFYFYCPESKQEFFYEINKNGKLVQPTTVDIKSKSFLKNYCFSMLQSAEYLVKKGLTKTK